jgi:hypothetical protein
MKIKIENYRGWDISFDTSKETFYVESDGHDRGEIKKSFALAKHYVDDFIKDNLKFKPVWVEKMEHHSFLYGLTSQQEMISKIKLIGIRKDKRFIYEGKDGKKEQLSEDSEKSYILSNEANDVHYAELKECRKRIGLILEETKVIKAKIIKVGLDELKAKFL